VTQDEATVQAAEDRLYAEVNPTPTYTLTTNIDNITATALDVTFTGVTGTAGGGTLNTGDILTGIGGTNTFNITGDGGTAAIVETSNIQNVNVRGVAAAGTTIDQILMSGVTNATSTGSIAGVAFTNAQLATTYSLNSTNNIASGNANLSVTYQAASGSADTALLSVNNAGGKVGSTTVTQTVTTTASSGDIEAISLETAGTNYVILGGGAKVTSVDISGSGTNEVTLTAAATKLNVDASAATGNNKITLTPVLSGTTNTVTGGSGSDTLVASLTSTTVSTISAIETLDLTFGAAATFNGLNVTDVTKIDITNTGAATISSLTDTVDTLVFDTSTAGAGASVSYVSGTSTDLTVNVGKTTTAGTSTDAIAIGGLTLANNAGAVTINSVSDKATTVNTTGAVGLGAATDLTVNATSSAVTLGAITGTALASVSLNATKGAIITGGFATATTIDSIAIAATAGSVTAGTFGVDNTFTSLDIDTGSGSADYTTSITLADTNISTATQAVNGVATISGSGDTSVTTTVATLFLGSVDATAATGSVTLDLSAYTGTKGFDISLGDAGTGETNIVNVAGATGAAVITGGSGADSIIGGSGADVVNSGAGADTVVGNAGADVITLGAGADSYVFANQVVDSLGAAAASTVTEMIANVGNDVFDSFVVADDTFVIAQAVFGTNFAAGAATAANFDVVATTATAINAATTDVGNVIVVQSAANAAASVYYVDVAGAGQTIADLVAAGDATLIGTLSSVTGSITTADFIVV